MCAYNDKSVKVIPIYGLGVCKTNPNAEGMERRRR